MWAIWDQGDGILDSTALIDDFQWSVDAANGTQTLPTVPKCQRIPTSAVVSGQGTYVVS